MKSLLTTILLLFISVILQAQKLDGHYIATVTRDTIVTTKWNTLDKSENILLSFRMVKHNSQFALELKFNFGDGPVFSVTKGDSVMIKFISGWGFSLYAKESVVSKVGLSSYSGSMSGAVTQGIYVIYPLTIGQLASFKSETIQKIRLYTSRGFDNFIFPESKYTCFPNAAINVSQHISDWIYIDHTEYYKPNNPVDAQKDDKW